jgi:cell division protein ZapA (FtsZ GTPase activity inhibitor)
MTKTGKKNPTLLEEIKAITQSIIELRENQEKISKQVNEEISKELKETDRIVRRLSKDFGHYQKGASDILEEAIYQKFKKEKKLGNIKFDTVAKNLRDLKREYDVVMKNGQYTAFIEVKQQAHLHDLDTLVKKQVADFKKGFNISDKEKIVLAIASPVITEPVKKKAEEKGVFVITQNGKNFQTMNSPAFKPQTY